MPERNIGYLLPEEPETSEFECCVVFYPARDAYRRALMGSLDYLGTWIAWEKEPERKGVVAARLWKIANELTRECCAMGFCQDILNRLDRIIALLALMRIDDGDTITYNDNRIVTTVIIPGVGPDPTLYGDIPVTDWDQWLEYVCGEANAWVDDLIETAEQMAILKTALGLTIEFFSHFFSRLVYRLPQPIIPMNYPFLAFVFDLLDDVIDEVSFSTVAANFETYRQGLVCAILQDGDLSAVVEEAVGDSVLWNAFYRWVDYDSVKATIFEGTPDGVNFLAPVPDDSCVCEYSGEFSGTETWGAPGADWVWTLSQCPWIETEGNPMPSRRFGAGQGGTIRITLAELKAGLAISSATEVYLKRLRIDWSNGVAHASPVVVHIGHTGGVYEWTQDLPTSGWETREIIFNPPLQLQQQTILGVGCVYLIDGHTTIVDDAYYQKFDNCYFEVDADF